MHDGLETLNQSDEALFGNSNYLPIIVLCRVDIVRDRIQVKYVLEEKKDTFDITCNDPQTFAYLQSRGRDYSEVMRHSQERLDKYQPLFDLLLCAPSVIDIMDSDDVVLERHPTKLRMDTKSPHAKLAMTLPLCDAPRNVVVKTLFDLGKPAATYDLKANDFAIETAGYWKSLPFGSQGSDRQGNPVQGKTWVTVQESWVETTRASAVERTSIDIASAGDGKVGELYVMRSALHPKDVYKVGFTTKSSDERARQLESTSGQPDMFNVVQTWKVKSPRIIEHEVHELLKIHRINTGREFFRLKYDTIRETIERVITKADALIE